MRRLVTAPRRRLCLAARKPRGSLPKSFDHATVEPRLYRWWESEGYFEPRAAADPNAKPFVIVMPPPNVTGALHMGHALFVAIEDMLIRHYRMRGIETLWLPGTDHAGIATQLLVEKQLQANGEPTRQQLGREDFLKKVWQWRDSSGDAICEQLRRLGASCDWQRQQFTLDEGPAAAVREAFVQLHERGLIYRGEYLVNWSTLLQTAVSDLEVEYSEEQGTMVQFNYPLEKLPNDDCGTQFLPVCTTRLETVLADSAIAVHPEDPRWAELIGRYAVVPYTGRRIRIIADDAVDPEFGTGAVKITPAHDLVDHQMGQRHGLDTMNMLNKDGSVNEVGGEMFEGLDRYEARTLMKEYLKEHGLFVSEVEHTLRVPRSQRGGDVIEPLMSTQWFMDMSSLAPPALQAMHDRSLQFTPTRFEQDWSEWLSNIKPWCLSRQLWWGHRIPVWYVTKPDGQRLPNVHLVARSEEEAATQALNQGFELGPELMLVQDDDVLDTWFSSALWPFSALGWPGNDPAKWTSKYYPGAVLETGYDILFFWVARMAMMGIALTDKVPFEQVYLHGLVRDDQGRKMSKTLGNVVDPLTVVDEYGADALRFALLTGGAHGLDLNYDERRVLRARNFTTKLWNIGRLLEQQIDAAPADFHETVKEGLPERWDDCELSQRWIVSSFHMQASEVDRLMDARQLGDAANTLYSFVRNQYADWYLEASKLPPRNSANPQDPLLVTLYVWRGILRLLHPTMPFMTEELWSRVPGALGPLIVSQQPLLAPFPVDTQAQAQFSVMKDIVVAIRNARSEHGVKPSEKIGAALFIQDEQLLSVLQEEAGTVAHLARLDSNEFIFTGGAQVQEPVTQSIELVVQAGVHVFLPLDKLGDLSKHRERLVNQAGKLQATVQKLTKRLGSEKFRTGAPAAVVTKVEKELTEATEQLKAIEAQSTKLGVG